MSRLRCSPLHRIFVLALLVLLPAGCAIIPTPTRSARVGESDAPGNCADFFADLDQRAAQAQVLDPGAFRVEGYPYLRVNRFLASFRKEVGDPAAFAAWVDQMQALDQDARKHEIANLPRATGSTPGAASDLDELYGKVASCGNLLKTADFKDNQAREALREKAAAPDEYMLLPRVLGLYPLTSLFVSHGVSNWHAEARKTFSTEPPVGWTASRYVPEKSNELPAARAIVTQARRDALGIPDYSPDVRQVLFRIHAPIWEVRTEAEYDRIGTPVWTVESKLDIDTRQPLTYTLLSFTRFGKAILTQLNYIIWFPSRPRENALDIYGGQLDGLNYRVTLDTNGEPLLYETIHNCGCYYEAYPTQRLKVRDRIDYAEPPLILKAPELTPSNEFMTVTMESRTHYVQHLYPSARRSQPGAVVYSLADYGALQSLPDSRDGRKSMFSPDSLAPGSERLERFILWPTGVVSPGAMRQWGRHAVAFVGERHFDDPFSMDKMFMETD
ncbi:MAG TPA: hypothetical protein VLR50_16975 [Desulfobacterales bacterium]|nr:hypothetical protein [Desulfobacterales bacterium]